MKRRYEAPQHNHIMKEYLTGRVGFREKRSFEFCGNKVIVAGMVAQVDMVKLVRRGDKYEQVVYRRDATKKDWETLASMVNVSDIDDEGSLT